jgi:DNA-nicking Smr family endonuclease
MPGKSIPDEPTPAPSHPPAPILTLDALGHAAPTAVPKAKLPPLTAVERKTLKGLRRGAIAVEGRIDLHGMRQEEAHFALLGFLRRAQQKGQALVLVITGKGGAPRRDDEYGERGILRRMVPHWLSLPDLRGIVLGFEEAAQHHGGSGALYVRLRRPRGSLP